MIDLAKLEQVVREAPEDTFAPVRRRWLAQALAELEQGRAAQDAWRLVQGRVLDLPEGQ